MVMSSFTEHFLLGWMPVRTDSAVGLTAQEDAWFRPHAVGVAPCRSRRSSLARRNEGGGAEGARSEQPIGRFVPDQECDSVRVFVAGMRG